MGVGVGAAGGFWRGRMQRRFARRRRRRRRLAQLAATVFHSTQTASGLITPPNNRTALNRHKHFNKQAVSSGCVCAPRLAAAPRRAATIAAATRPAPLPPLGGSGGGAGSGAGAARERVLRSGDVTAATSALGTSLNYKIRPDGRPAPRGGASSSSGAGARASSGAAAAAAGPVREFVDKLWLAWQIFFPERAPEVSPKDGAKQRLRMILVADRCGMSPNGLAEMKRNILRALEEFVDIESEEQIDVSINVDNDVGTVYCVAVPVRRVKPEARAGLEAGAGLEGVAGVEWDPENHDSDPSSRFPMGC